MLQLTPHHRILLAVSAVDFRKGIDGLAAVCRQQLTERPDSGYIPQVGSFFKILLASLDSEVWPKETSSSTFVQN